MPAARRQPAVGGRITLRRAALLLLSGLILAAPGASPAGAQQASAERPSRSDPYGAFITEAAQRFGVPEAWIRAVMRVESAGDVRAISSAGAMGLMQIMPATWAELRVRHRLGSNPYDPRDNILAGAAYLRDMHDRYGSPGFLAAYNAGPGRYEEYLAGRPLPAETRAYVTTLAPIVGGGELAGPVVVAAADPLAWTRAPLFVVQSAGSGPAAPTQSEGAPGNSTASAPERDQGPAASRTDGLFVARNVAGGPQ
ncbi:lytic transglycosylase domain-containing protein [Methylorubrum populi]|jgi:soluble lytic murein transglycosylase-like protein|uniref:lytic transglycosylase domain-containing protein n=1 Tax=Alphaproteobacteria TaxID=28211 RepID=UPI000C146537|nr:MULTISPECIES: lytic transglycosylase domain-containing protein [Alphaproteobacteria]MCX4195684.1 lytic transglycosylase domain-containing protein [Methylobacterium organophilum]AZS21176.1 lytic transglycosylase domain-containing protein [Caulobacter sp. FWC26]MBR3193339.1 lytic transglycosylase domain-containing protein [Bosea sp. (in: a-proteobacteria)]MDH0612898.1 lytic transglycosylase domain-containing protein [Agrobacterium sp. GD03872]MDH0694762.1 lytic transglycosylase domain-contain